MDGKLASGYTKQGFRKDFAPAPARSTAMGARMLEFYRLVRERNSVPKAFVADFISAELKAKSNPHELLVVERRRNAGRASLTQNPEESLTGGYFVPGRATINGNLEQIRQYIMFHDRLNRHTLDGRYLEHSIIVREHALKRFIERDGGSFYELSPALWPGFLILEVMLLGSRGGDMVPFMLPAVDGVFLGYTAWRSDPGSPMVMRFTMTKDGINDEKAALFGERWPFHLINTYVSLREMSIQQEELAVRIKTFIATNLDALKALHFMDVLKFGTKADGQIINSLMPVDFEKFRASCLALIDGPLWKNQVRLPRKLPASGS